MAARRHAVALKEPWREKIRTAMLVKRLQDNAMGIVELTLGQIKSIEILLRKTAPDLAQVEHKGEVTHNCVARIPAPETEADEWQRKYAPALPSLTRQ